MPKKKGQEEGKRLVTNTAYDLHVADGHLKGAAQLQFYYHPSHPPELAKYSQMGLYTCDGHDAKAGIFNAGCRV